DRMMILRYCRWHGNCIVRDVDVLLNFVTPYTRYVLGTYDSAGQSRVLQSNSNLPDNELAKMPPKKGQGKWHSRIWYSYEFGGQTGEIYTRKRGFSKSRRC